MGSIFNVRHRKVGGVWFLRVGRLQFSFCLCRGFNKPARRRVAYYGGNAVVVSGE